MATVSTHLLDSVTGKSAAGVRSQLFRIDANSRRHLLFDVETDEEGRIAEVIVLGSDAGCEFELVFHARDYFTSFSLGWESPVSCVVIRFAMDDDAKRYHLPVMLSPHSYSTWWSW